MKKFLPFLFICSINWIYCQVWCEPGAKWTYNYSSISSGGTDIWQYSRDSIIQNRPVQIIDVTKHLFQYNQFGQLFGNVYNGTSQITSSSGDSVFYYDIVKDKFFLLYNFGASVGDEWIVSEEIVTPECDSISIVKVISTGDTLINGVLLRTITLQSLNNGQFGIDGIVIERLGVVNSNMNHFGFLPGGRDCPNQQGVIEWDYYSLRCFEDTFLGNYQVDTVDCNYLTVGIEDNNIEFGLYPNPSDSWLTLKINSIKGSPLNGQITTLQGEKVMDFELSSNQNEIDIQLLEKGMYLLWVGQTARQFIKF
jgi:hypothetical protein